MDDIDFSTDSIINLDIEDEEEYTKNIKKDEQHDKKKTDRYLKRRASNNISARESRRRKRQYEEYKSKKIIELEAEVKKLKNQIAKLTSASKK